MSTSTCTDLWLSPKDYEKKKVRELLADSWEFEYDDESAETPDKDGLIRLYASEHSSYDELDALCALGISFIAWEDSRGESEGGQWGYVAHRKSFAYMQEDGAGFPVVRVGENGKVKPADLQNARIFWKLRKKVVAAAKKKLAVVCARCNTAVMAATLTKHETNECIPICCDCRKPIVEGQESMARNRGQLSHLDERICKAVQP